MIWPTGRCDLPDNLTYQRSDLPEDLNYQRSELPDDLTYWKIWPTRWVCCAGWVDWGLCAVMSCPWVSSLKVWESVCRGIFMVICECQRAWVCVCVCVCVCVRERERERERSKLSVFISAWREEQVRKWEKAEALSWAYTQYFKGWRMQLFSVRGVCSVCVCVCVCSVCV